MNAQKSGEASPAQLRLVSSLLTQYGRPETIAPGSTLDQVLNRQPVAREAASKLIDALIERGKALPRKPKVEIAEGMWIAEHTDVDGETHARIFKVQVAVHGSGRLYAKELNPTNGKFEYAPGGVKFLATEGRQMTLDEAREYGTLYGRCIVCGRTLTDEDSIRSGNRSDLRWQVLGRPHTPVRTR